jgi:hypothetical protein
MDEVEEYLARHLSPMEITTSTIAYDSDMRMSYQDLSKYVKEDGERILAVKSTCIPLEVCMQNKYTKADKIMKKRERNKLKQCPNKTKPSRTLAGNTLYFNSSVEFVVSAMDGTEKYHNIRISPSKGSIQIQGVKPPIYETAQDQIRFILDHISEKMCTEESYKIYNRRVIIINEKTEIYRPVEEFIRIDELSRILAMYIRETNEEMVKSPYQILYVDSEFEAGSYIRVKFLTPIESNPNRKTTVKIFSGRKINILGCPDTIAPARVYKFLDELIDVYQDRLFFKKIIRRKDIDDVLEEIDKLKKPKYAWATMIRL